VKAAEDGHAGNPHEYRDYLLRRPSYSGAAVTESAGQTSEPRLALQEHAPENLR
jgi:hypothetical protein